MPISFKSLYYDGYPLPDNLYSKKMKVELTQSVDSMSLTYGKIHNPLDPGALKVCELNYVNGLVNLNVMGKDQKGEVVHEKLILDVLMINFFLKKLPLELSSFQRSSKTIENFVTRLESIPCYEDAKKISEVYFAILKKYIEKYDQEKEGLRGNPINNFSNYLVCSKGVKGFFQLQSPILFTTPAIGDLNLLPKKSRFYKLITKSLSISLTTGEPGISVLFLQHAVSQKTNFQEKKLFLKQVLFMCLFKGALYSILQSLEAQMERLPFSEKDLNNRNQLEYIRNSLSKFSVSDLLLIIALSCRSSPIDKESFSLFVSKEFEEDQIDRARIAYEIFIKIFIEHFGFSHEKLGNRVSKEVTQLKQEEAAKTNRFIKTLSSMAISRGPFARSAFYNYCLENEDDLCENLPLELVVTAAQHYSLGDHWLEEVYLGYIYKIFGRISLSDIALIRDKIEKITNFTDTIPIEGLLKKNKQDEATLDKNIIDKLKEYYVQGYKSLNMHLAHRNTEVLCSIS
ncbi:MAG: hypothetical protein ACRCSV_04690 [Chlamydiales bacterium]